MTDYEKAAMEYLKGQLKNGFSTETSIRAAEIILRYERDRAQMEAAYPPLEFSRKIPGDERA